MFTAGYADVFAGDDNWRSMPTSRPQTFAWDATSTYVRRPPYFDGMPRRTGTAARHHRRPGAGLARRLGDHRPHLTRRRDQEGLPGRALPDRARGRRRATSTPTAPGAATTR